MSLLFLNKGSNSQFGSESVNPFKLLPFSSFPQPVLAPSFKCRQAWSEAIQTEPSVVDDRSECVSVSHVSEYCTE